MWLSLNAQSRPARVEYYIQQGNPMYLCTPAASPIRSSPELNASGLRTPLSSARIVMDEEGSILAQQYRVFRAVCAKRTIFHWIDHVRRMQLASRTHVHKSCTGFVRKRTTFVLKCTK